MNVTDRLKKNGPGLLEQDGAEKKVHTAEHAEIIPRTKKTVKRTNWLKDFHMRKRLKPGEIVETVRLLFPGFDKPLLSKCENPERYGVQLSQKAIRLLKDTFGGDDDAGPS